MYRQPNRSYASVVVSGTNAGGDNLLEKELEEFELQEHVEEKREDIDEEAEEENKEEDVDEDDGGDDDDDDNDDEEEDFVLRSAKQFVQDVIDRQVNIEDFLPAYKVGKGAARGTYVKTIKKTRSKKTTEELGNKYLLQFATYFPGSLETKLATAQSILKMVAEKKREDSPSANLEVDGILTSFISREGGLAEGPCCYLFRIGSPRYRR
jgi:hypothetical protein